MAASDNIAADEGAQVPNGTKRNGNGNLQMWLLSIATAVAVGLSAAWAKDINGKVGNHCEQLARQEATIAHWEKHFEKIEQKLDAVFAFIQSREVRP